MQLFTKKQLKVEHYRILQGYWTQEQQNIFVDNHKSLYNTLFYVQLLAAEGKHRQIMEILKKYQKQEVQAFDKMLAMVAHHYPDECMDLVMEKTEHTLQSDHRSRHTYRDITSWLNVLKTIPSLEDQLKLFCQHLYDQYSRLRALREELQYTGLIRRK